MNDTEIQGRYFKNLIHYIIPSAYSLVGNSIALVIVGVWISRQIGSNALGAVNIVAPYLSFVYAYGLIFGMGGGTLASSSNAKGKSNEADRTFTLSLLLLVISMAVIAALSYFNLNGLAILLGATEGNIELVKEYMRYITVSSTLFALGYAMNIQIRFDGYQFRACVGTTLNVVTTLLVSYICIHILGLGIAGAAIGLVASRIVIILYYIGHFLSPHTGFRFRLSKHNLLRDSKQIIMIGIPNALSEASTGIFILVFNYIVIFWLGNEGLIIFSVIYYLSQLTVQVMLGIVQGMQPIISFHYPKAEYSICFKYLRYTLGLTALFSIGFTVAGYVFSDTIAGMYIPAANGRLFTEAVNALKIFSWSSLAVGINIAFIAYYSAADKARRSMVLSWGRSLIIMCATALALPHVLGNAGIWLAPVVNEFIVLAIVFCYCIKDRVLKELIPTKLRMLCAGYSQ